jgi:hypothetical protein
MTDALIVDRLQFATTVTFPYLIAQLTMGLALMIVLFGTIGYRRRDEDYGRAAHFWTTIFAITFAFGVATGVPMEFQFGTNWASISQFAGGCLGHPLRADRGPGLVYYRTGPDRPLHARHALPLRRKGPPDRRGILIPAGPQTAGAARAIAKSRKEMQRERQSGGSVKAEGLGDGLPHGKSAIAKLRRLRLTLPPHPILRLCVCPVAG